MFLSNPTTTADWLIIYSVKFSSAGNYSCFANNSYGSAESKAASLTIGNVLPCCSHYYLHWDTRNIQRVGRLSRISIYFYYSGYTISNVTVTKDGYHYHTDATVFFGRHQEILFPMVTVNDTGVYGWHLTLSSLSNSAVLQNLTFSIYTALLVEVPLQISINPHNVLLRDFNEDLHISCSVYHSLQFSPKVSWFKNSMPVGSDSISKETGHITTYLRVNNTPEALNHYTCKVSTVTGLTGRATVSVVFRVDEGGWSWWMETVPCSVTCGITEGIRMRSRRCYNESSRCPGDSLQRTTCYSPLLNCPFERNVSPTTMSGKAP